MLFTPELMTNIVSLAVLILTAVVGWGVRRLYSSIPADKANILNVIAGMVVPAIEQEFKDLENASKRIQAVNKVRLMLHTLGIKNIPDALIETAIESAVFALKHPPIIPTQPIQRNTFKTN